MPTKNTIYDFWKVSIPETFNGGFKQALFQLSQTDDVSARNQSIDGDIVRWEELDLSDSRYLYGDFGKLRMQVLPQMGGIDQLSSPLPFDRNEGIDELFAFMYDMNSQILVTQYNHYGSSLRLFTKYLTSKINFGGPVHVFPILSQTGAEKLRNLDNISKITYKVARPTTQALNPLASDSFDTAISQLESFGAQTVVTTISMDRKRSSLITNTVRRVFHMLTENHGSNASLEKFEVSGDHRGERDEFDLVRDRMRHRENLPISENRSISFSARISAARRAFEAKRDELIAQFGENSR